MITAIVILALYWFITFTFVIGILYEGLLTDTMIQRIVCVLIVIVAAPLLVPFGFGREIGSKEIDL